VRRLQAVVSRPFPSRLSCRALESRHHAFEGHDAVAASKKIVYKTPIQWSVRPDTHPLATAVRRDEKLLSTEEQANIGAV